jgi:hypothetical protein
MGYTSEDIGNDENYGDLKIIAYAKPGVIHEYVMPKSWPLNYYRKKFNLWIKLMKKERYVCLAGGYINCDNKVERGKSQQVYSWVIKKVKTKKGWEETP